MGADAWAPPREGSPRGRVRRLGEGRWPHGGVRWPPHGVGTGDGDGGEDAGVGEGGRARRRGPGVGEGVGVGGFMRVRGGEGGGRGSRVVGRKV